jgi:hypothetical protein
MRSAPQKPRLMRAPFSARGAAHLFPLSSLYKT